MRWVTTIAAVLLTTGCAMDGAAPPQGGPTPANSSSITYETQPCFGACPVYAVSVSRDGHGTFTGKRFTTVIGERDFSIDPTAFDRFAATLAPYRPTSGEVRYEMGSANCGPAPTDMPSVDVSWSGQAGSGEKLHFYLGCRSKNPDLATALRSAPDVLPIADLIGKR